MDTGPVNWDRYKNAVYDDHNPAKPDPSNAVGLARVSSVVNQIRADRGRDHTLLFDAGDTIQGTPPGFYYATVEPITKTGAVHPMAAQMNAIGYDAVALGNHELNNAQVAIREAIVAYATAAGTIDPKDFHEVNWRLVQGGVPVFWRPSPHPSDVSRTVPSRSASSDRKDPR